jgi:EAL domain-containing protein (putative c-di-GMP-specific phosphodiesterase class I)
VYLGRSLHLCVVAEGVETPEQRATLQQMQCDQYQGYLCSPALPASDFACLLAGQGSGAAFTPP